jgi:hypothetical protein
VKLVRILLLSTYELGHQPLGLAGPAALLRESGHDVTCRDLSLEPLAAAELEWAQAVAVSVPMHTATRLALEVLARIRRERPGLPVAFYGLYAPVLASHELLAEQDLLAAGDTGPILVGWLNALRGRQEQAAAAAHRPGDPGGRPVTTIDLGSPAPSQGAARPPARAQLPPLDRYAYLQLAGELVTVGSVAASEGCNHKCGHCPVAAVYEGRSRKIDAGSVRADIDQVVEMGAGHVSFADPDFLNRPRHALAVARELHERHPSVTFDATVKIEHILRHRDLFPELRASGLIFLTSAFESTDDDVLRRLDKGHTAVDESTAIDIARAAGIEIRPSWLPFNPWTTFASLAGLLNFSATHDLVASTDPVQYSIRLLLPRGSLLLRAGDLDLTAAIDRAAAADAPCAGGAPERPAGGTDGGGFALSVPWLAGDPALDELQLALVTRAEVAESAGETLDETFAALWALARQAGVPLAHEPPAPAAAMAWRPGPERPRLSESWFCCAEPTTTHARLVAAGT